MVILRVFIGSHHVFWILELWNHGSLCFHFQKNRKAQTSMISFHGHSGPSGSLILPRLLRLPRTSKCLEIPELLELMDLLYIPELLYYQTTCTYQISKTQKTSWTLWTFRTHRPPKPSHIFWTSLTVLIFWNSGPRNRRIRVDSVGPMLRSGMSGSSGSSKRSKRSGTSKRFRKSVQEV